MKIVDLTGNRYNKLVVIKRLTSTRDGSRLYLCQCDCGKQVSVTGRHLNRKNNTIGSCGCLKYRKGKDHPDWKGVGDISGDWWSTRVVRSGSLRKHLHSDITKEYAWDLFLKQDRRCHFTGLSLEIHEKGSASLDRIDNTIGYVEGNVRWVHKDINFMRRVYEDDYFIEMCKLVADNM